MDKQLPEVIEIPSIDSFNTIHPDENQESINQHELPNPPIDFQRDSFDVENNPVKNAEPEPIDVDFERSFQTRELSLELQNHLENALKEIVHITSERQKEREAILEAEQKIRYKILEEAEYKGPFKKGIPVVKPRRVIVRRKKVINPARRIPKYLPTVDGDIWKVWGYPEFVELSTSSSEEVVEIPEGVELDQDGYLIIDPDRFDFTSLSPKWLRVLSKAVLFLLQSVTGFFMVKYGVKLWKSYTREVHYKHKERPPNISESSDTDSENDPRLLD